MSTDWQFVGVCIATVSAAASAISAGVNWYNTKTFIKQLKNTSADACLAAAIALQAAVHRTIALQTNKEEDSIAPAQIWSASDEAWRRWGVLNQTFQVAQRYRPGLVADNFNAPDKLLPLLSQLRINLRDTKWIPDENDPNDIRRKLDSIVKEIKARVGLAKK